MDSAELRAILAAKKRAALGDELGSRSGASLAEERARALDYYLGEMDADMPPPEGRSRAVSSDVADTVESLMPALMEIFASGDEIVEFRPVGPEDVEAARQETDYVNHVFHQQNAGFLVLYSFIKDALLSKAGVVKLWWDEGESAERETYVDQPEEAYLAIVADPELEILEHTENEGRHDVTVVRRKPYGCARVMAVPPQEFRISRRARTIQDSPYCAHVVRRTVSDLIAAGYDRALLERLPDAGGEEAGAGEDDAANRAMREVEVTEHYARIDWDGDGIAELRKITTAGAEDVILTRGGAPDNVPFDRMPFAAMTPIILTHRFFGRSIADLALEVQRIKTALLRALLDSAYFANNQRIEVAESHSGENTLDDLLTNRPGGVVRTKQPGGVAPIAHAGLGFDAYRMLEYVDTVREHRTGTMRYMQGLKPDTLHATASGANQMLSLAQQRVKLIARIFAETGIKDLFLGLHALICKHAREPGVVRLRGKWVPVDPRQWKTRADMTVTVGLGAGSRETQQAFLAQLLGIQMRAVAAQGGVAGPLVTLENLHATLKRMVENAGLRDPAPFFQDPSTAPGMAQPAPPPPDPRIAAMQAKLQVEREKLAMEHGLELKRLEMEIGLKREQMQAELALKREQMAAGIAARVHLGGRPG